MYIPFNKPACTGNEEKHILAAIKNRKLSGDGPYGLLCQQWFEEHLGCKKALLTPSCTQALEMAAILIDIQPGDEVIMPSFTFVSTANAFALHGAKIVFVDIKKESMNINEDLVESAITDKTKAIVAVDYAGVSCNIQKLSSIAKAYGIYLIEDAAQAIMSQYKDRPVGAFSDLSAYSFHETKNITSGGEGGLLAINDERLCERAEIIREKGTNRKQFFRGMVDKYSWVDIGSSYLPSELQAAYLWGQLESADEITTNRLHTWKKYQESFDSLSKSGRIELPTTPSDCKHNGHIFYIKTNNINERAKLIDHLQAKEILAVFHYIPLHSSKAGIKYSRFHGTDTHTTTESEKILRLPLWYGMSESEIDSVISNTINFFDQKPQ